MLWGIYHNAGRGSRTRRKNVARYTDAELQQLKRNTSLAELCRARGIDLRPHGRKDLVGRCPFHEDEKPSFIVTPEKNLFHCLGCGAAGSVVDFVMKLEGGTFKETVDRLLGSTSRLHRASEPPPKPRPTVYPERARQLFERVVSIYEKNLSESPEGKEYLALRGIKDAGLLTRHRVGYCNGRLKEILPSGGQLLDELHALGILLEDQSERFTGCVVFPVYDVDGEFVTLYGRYTGDGQKRHLYLPERPTGLWNAGAVKTYSEVILVESVLDALSVQVAGCDNVASIQGTNGLGDAELFTQYGVQSVTLLLDGDAAGQKAALRLKEKLSGQVRCRIKLLPEEHDPNSFFMAQGGEALGRFLAEESEARAEDTRASTSESARTPSLKLGPRHYDIHGLEKGPRRLRVTVRVEHAGRLHVDTLDLYSARSRRGLVQDLCRVFEESPDTIEADVGKLLKHCEGLPEPGEGDGQAEVVMTAKEKEEAEAFGKSPDLIERILAGYETCGLVGEEPNKLLAYLACVSRKTEHPLSVLILSSSGAGKTALQDAALAFCPPEEAVKLTSLSGKALFYKERTSLKHKVLALEEGEGAEDASYAIRNLISAGVLVVEAAVKDPVSGKITTMENRVEGPTAVFVTTTNPETDPETKSRFFVTAIDESREQTRRILAFQRQRQTLRGISEDRAAQETLRVHRNFQRLLQPVAVVNPFGESLGYGDDRLQGRRDQPKYLNLIKAVAFLRQMQKPVKLFGNNGTSAEYIEVDEEDIRLANELAREILGQCLTELSKPSRTLLFELEKLVEARLEGREGGRSSISFSRREIREYTGWSNYRVHTHLRELIEYEYLAMETDRLTGSHRYRLLYDGQGKEGERFFVGLQTAE